MLCLEASLGADQAYLGNRHRHTQFLRLAFVCFDSCCNKKCLIEGFSWGHRLASSCSFFLKKYLTADKLLIASLLLKTGGISGVTSKTKFHISKKAKLVTTASSPIIGSIAGVCFAIEV